MSEFEQNFMSQVKGGVPVGGVVPGPQGEKKKLDKRWLVLGGLIVGLVIVVVVLGLVRGGAGGANNNGSAGSGGVTVNVVGKWLCSDDGFYNFYEDGSFFNHFEERGVAAMGTYRQDGSRVIVKVGEPGAESLPLSMEVGEHGYEVRMSAAVLSLRGMSCERREG